MLFANANVLYSVQFCYKHMLERENQQNHDVNLMWTGYK